MHLLSIKSGLAFWLHVASVIATWLMPFLVSWPVAVAVYAAVMIQFAIWGKCLMNEHHGLNESDGRIFYTDLLEKMGFKPHPPLVKTIVRRWLYPSLALLAFTWQYLLQHPPLLF
ncbi:MAG: hypothetical protein SFV22_03525 [Saprospiraceae bacterium]|nr:hypothetical protein [Saprospiraceae bacterium]